MIRAMLVLAMLATAPVCALAQTQDNNADDSFSMTPQLDLGNPEFDDVQAVEQPRAEEGTGAVLRGLDRVSGNLSDLEMTIGQTSHFGRLDVTLGDCRYPGGDPSSDAYAYMVIRAEGVERPVFEGWMIASSPALNALDHPRYDIWVLRCITS